MGKGGWAGQAGAPGKPSVPRGDPIPLSGAGQMAVPLWTLDFHLCRMQLLVASMQSTLLSAQGRCECESQWCLCGTRSQASSKGSTLSTHLIHINSITNYHLQLPGEGNWGTERLGHFTLECGQNSNAGSLAPSPGSGSPSLAMSHVSVSWLHISWSQFTQLWNELLNFSPLGFAKRVKWHWPWASEQCFLNGSLCYLSPCERKKRPPPLSSVKLLVS